MDDGLAKEHLHEQLRWVREALVWKLEGLSDYDVRRPLTVTGTNLLGLVKHNAIWDSRYFGEVFGRPYPEPLPRWDDALARGTDHWATGDETRSGVLGLYHRVWAHVDATVAALPLDSPGFVPWWDEHVQLFHVLVHRLSDATRHAGHADILREQLDGAVGVEAAAVPSPGRDAHFWATRHAELARIAIAARDPATEHLLEQLAAAGMHPAVLNHGARVHAIAQAQAEVDGVVIDPLVLAIACLFHDSGTISPRTPARFEVAGADLARAYAESHGVDPRAGQEIWDAVALHTSPGIAEGQRPLSRVLRYGVRTDLGELTARAQHADLLARLETRWPRDGVEVVLAELVVTAARADPRRATAPSWTADLVRGSSGLAPGARNPCF